MSVKVTFRANRNGQRALGNSNAVYRELERRAEKVIALARASAAGHRVTGEYDRSFRTERTRIGGRAAVRVVNDANASIILELGSRPHVIRSHGDYPLRSADGRVFGKEVRHPGTPAYHFLRNALRKAGT